MPNSKALFYESFIPACKMFHTTSLFCHRHLAELNLLGHMVQAAEQLYWQMDFLQKLILSLTQNWQFFRILSKWEKIIQQSEIYMALQIYRLLKLFFIIEEQDTAAYLSSWKGDFNIPMRWTPQKCNQCGKVPEFCGTHFPNFRIHVLPKPLEQLLLSVHQMQNYYKYNG